MRLAILFLLACSAWGQTTLSTFDVPAGSISRTAALVKATFGGSPSSVNAYMRWHTGTFTDCTTGTVWRTTTSGTSSTFELPLGGLLPNTKYYIGFCVQTSDTWIGGGDEARSFTTAADAASRPVYPTAPTATGITGVTPTPTDPYTVGSDCGHASTGLQAHINTAAPLSGATVREIIIPTTTTNCTGTYTLKNRSGGGTGKIIIRSDRLDRLPPDNGRVSLALDQQHMFQLRPPINTYSFTCEVGAADYIIIGYDYLPSTGDSVNAGQIAMTTNCTRVVFDRGVSLSRLQPDRAARNFSLNGTNSGVINSWIQCSRGPGTDPDESVCIASDNGHGVLIQNNRITGSGITTFFTDSAGTDKTLDLVYKRNLVIGDERQRQGSATSDGNMYTLRQPVEIKRCNRCSFTGNIFENWWNSDQFAVSVVFLISPRGDEDRVVADIEFGYNFLRGTTSGFSEVTSLDDTAARDIYPLQRIWMHDNVQIRSSNQYTCTGCTGGGPWRAPVIRIGGTEDFIFERNTHYDPDYGSGADGGRFIDMINLNMGDPVFRDNLGVFMDNGGGLGGCTANITWFDGSKPTTCIGMINEAWSRNTFTGNVVRAKSPSTTTDVNNQFTGTNTQAVSSIANVGFSSNAALTSTLSRDFRLDEFTSTYRSAGSDGRAPGANWIRVQEEIGGVQGFAVTAITATTISVTFKAYGGMTGPGTACYVDANTSATFANVPVRQIATVNSAVPSQQSATLTVSSATDYRLRVHCGGEPFVYGGETAPITVRTR